MTDRLERLRGAKCLVEAWEQKYGVGGHHTRWVDLRPSDVEWAVAEIERLREALQTIAKIGDWKAQMTIANNALEEK